MRARALPVLPGTQPAGQGRPRAPHLLDLPPRPPGPSCGRARPSSCPRSNRERWTGRGQPEHPPLPEDPAQGEAATPASLRLWGWARPFLGGRMRPRRPRGVRLWPKVTQRVTVTVRLESWFSEGALKPLGGSPTDPPLTALPTGPYALRAPSPGHLSPTLPAGRSSGVC